MEYAEEAGKRGPSGSILEGCSEPRKAPKQRPVVSLREIIRLFLNVDELLSAISVVPLRFAQGNRFYKRWSSSTEYSEAVERGKEGTANERSLRVMRFPIFRRSSGSMALTPRYRRILIVSLAALAIAGLVAYRLNRGERPVPPVPKSASVRETRTAPPLAVPLADQHKHIVKLERYYGRAPIVIVFFDKDTGADEDPYLTQLRDCFERLEADGVEVVGISRASSFENQQAEERAGEPFQFPLLSDIHPAGHSPAPVSIQFGLFDVATQSTRTAVFLIDRAGQIAWDGAHPRPVRDPGAAIDSICRGEWPTVQ
jgi:peroxiredoxin